MRRGAGGLSPKRSDQLGHVAVENPGGQNAGAHQTGAARTIQVLSGARSAAVSRNNSIATLVGLIGYLASARRERFGGDGDE